MSPGEVAASALPLLRVMGMRRSGNHAVIDWLRRNVDGPVVFLNDCTPGDPYARFEMMVTPGGERHGPSFRATPWFAQFPSRRARRAHIVSYEDQAPQAIATTGFGRPFADIVVRRSFLNWLASYYRLTAGRQAGTGWGVDRPDRIAARFLAWRALTHHARRPDVVDVPFDDWIAAPARRAAILARLGLALCDDDTGAEQPYGGGSSFAGGPDPAALTERWRELASDPGFVGLIRRAASDARLMGTIETSYPADAALLRGIAQDDAPA